LFIKNLSVLGSTMGPRSALPKILEHVRAGRYEPVVDRVLPMRQARARTRCSEAHQVAGKIVLVPGQ